MIRFETKCFAPHDTDAIDRFLNAGLERGLPAANFCVDIVGYRMNLDVVVITRRVSEWPMPEAMWKGKKVSELNEEERRDMEHFENSLRSRG